MNTAFAILLGSLLLAFVCRSTVKAHKTLPAEMRRADRRWAGLIPLIIVMVAIVIVAILQGDHR